MEEALPFEFQSESFGNYEEDLLSHGNAFGFGSTEWEHIDFGRVPELDHDLPGLSPDTSLKDTENSPKSSGTLSPEVVQQNVPSEINSASRSQKSHTRFSKKARSVLRTWFINHKDHAYPTPDEKLKLAEETGLHGKQVSLWLANARRRNKPKQQNSFPPNDLPEIPEFSSFQIPEQDDSMAMPPPPLPSLETPMVDTDEQAKLWLPDLKPFDRWKADYRLWHEPAEISNISDAVSRSTSRAPEPLTPEAVAHNDAPAEYAPSAIMEYNTADNTTGSTSEFDAFWGQSMHSYSTGLTGLGSASYFSDQTVLSYPHSNAGFLDTGSLASFEDVKPRRRCKAKRAIPKGGKFQCTFCTNRSFKTKHDWQRHEKSQHLNIESWACCAFGTGTIDTAEGPVCAFCTHPHPDAEHLETHHYSACQDKGLSERTFYRKDHFKQHLTLVHECGYTPNMDIFKVEFPNIVSRCGFCNIQLNSWQNRVDHLAGHFKAGMKMSEWKGGLGFEAHIASIIDFGLDFDPKIADPDFGWGPSAKATEMSSKASQYSLDYREKTDSDLLNQFPDATLGTFSSADFMGFVPAVENTTLETGLGAGGGISAPSQERLYDIFECTTGLCED